MFKKISSFFLAFLIFSMPVYAQTAEIQNTGTSPYKAIRLTPEVYHGANSDLSDLRLTNSRGEIVPYFIYSGAKNSTLQSEIHPLALLNAYLKDDAFYFDYQVANPPDGDVLATSLTLSTKSINFAKDITVLGSYDNRHWEKVQDDSLYQVEDKSKLKITFLSPQKYTHYRLKLGNNLEQIAFDSVVLEYNRVETQADYFRESLRPHFTTEEAGQHTLLHIEGLKNLKLQDITLETDSLFKRQVTDPFGNSKELYNLSFEQVSYQDITLPLNNKHSGDDLVTLKISNNDDHPIHITGVVVNYCAEDIIFAADAAETDFTLNFGSDPTLAAPVYDIASYQNDILQGKIDRLPLGEVVYPQSEPDKTPHDTVIFNVVIFLIAALLGVLILLKLRKNIN